MKIIEIKSAAPAPAAPDTGRERKTLTLHRPFEIKDINEAERSFTGLAAAYSLDLGGDVILPGAFKRTLKDWARGKRILPLLDSHNGFSTVRAVVGKITAASETAEGLEITASVIEGPDGDEVYRRIKGKYIDGLSIGYRTVEQRAPTEEESLTGIWRFIKELQLKEVSVCIWPMNQDARVDLASVKHLLDESTGRTLDADELDELTSVNNRITALLQKSAPGKTDPPAPATAGLAPEDPRRVAMEATLRDLTLRRLGAGPQ